MKKIYLLLFLCSCLMGNVVKGACPAPNTTYTIGPTGNYASIGAVITDLSSCGGITGFYIFEFQSTYVSTVETFPITIPNFGGNSTNTVTFRPASNATNILITSNNINGTIKFNGAQYVYFDGRAGGLGSSKNLTIENTDSTLYTASGATSSGTTVTVGSTTGLSVGMYVGIGPGGGYFGPNAKVQSILSATTFQVDITPVIALGAGNTVTAGWRPCAVIFENGAAKNAVRYCTLRSANQNVTSGTVFFSTAVGTVGNNNNAVTNNDIRECTTGSFPLVGVFADAFQTAGQYNSGDTISYNNIYNYYKYAASSTGALLRCPTNWVIAYNSFYQTGGRSLLTNTVQATAINVTGLLASGGLVSATNIGNNNLVRGNYVGGTSANAGGSSMTYNGSGNFVGIAVWAGTTTKTIVDSNVVQNVSFTTVGTGIGPRGMAIFQGTVDCLNNTIGSTSVANSIQFYINANSITASMINAGAANPTAGVLNISKNTISNVLMSSSGTSTALRCISVQGTPDSLAVDNNTINNISSPSNITIRGVFSSSTSTKNTINSNKITNITQTSTGAAAEVTGIWTQSATNTINFTVKNNNINNLSSATTNTGTNGVVVGIKIVSSGASHTIEQDTVYAIRANNTSSAAVQVAGIGIYPSSISGSGGTVSKNIIYDLTNTNVNSSGLISGYVTNGGSWNFSNNMVSLTNSSNTNAVLMEGVRDTGLISGTRNYIYNSIYIGGTGASDSYGAALHYNCGAGSAIIKNNILVMERSKGAGSPSFYAIANKTNTTTGFTSDNNILNCSYASSLGLWGATLVTGDKTFAAWQTAVSGESSSYTGEFVPFVSTSAGNLHIDTTNATLIAGGYVSNIESRGVVISGTTVDFDNDTRQGPTGSVRGGASAPDIGADEVDLTYSGDIIWNGTTSDDWATGTNWSTGTVPNSSSKVVVPLLGGSLPYPIITATANAKNIITGVGSSVTINSTGTLNVTGVYQNNSTLTNNGTIRFNGSAAQLFSGSGSVSAMNNFIVNNAAGLTISQSFSLTGTLTPTSGTVNLNNADITLKSTSGATASVGQVGGSFGYTGTGKFIIERYIPAHRAWRLLTSPTEAATGQSINAAWQEGATPKSPMGAEPIASAYNPYPGYGTHISGGATGFGYDANTSGNASLKYYTGSAWQNVSSSLYTTKVTDRQGYMLFVRGSRALDLTQGTNLVADNTTLRSSGRLKTGPQTITASGNTVIGNPYASAIDFHQIALASGFTGDTYYLWDPALTGSYNVGAWVTFSYNGSSYDRIITDSIPVTAYTGAISANGVIESGAAFVVNFTGDIVIDETAKTTHVNNAMFRPARTRVNLLAVNADNTISTNDGILITYGDEYSNDVNERDALKLSNFNESFSSRRDGKLLSIERRKTIPKDGTDTIFFNLATVQLKNYIFEIKADSMDRNNLAAFLEDGYLNTITPVSLKDTVRVGFSFNTNPASYNRERFKLVFKPSVKFTEVKADLQNTDIGITWTVAGEYNLYDYAVERSTDSVHYEQVATQLSSGNSTLPVTYSFIDGNVASGKNYYYRILSTSKAGVKAYSDPIKIAVLKNTPQLYVFPNPVTNNVIGLKLNTALAGAYLIELSTIKGESLYSTTVQHLGSNGAHIIRPGKKLNAGVYLLTVASPAGSKSVIKIMVK
ncbi:beta strand repeat-containing protein [Ferruginibacter sp. SUN002]|uniref:beta strand repeat-containing protein n=1 Tax=Ferruginibacter sp. SUN002 TaxID=2937789 RepID=UPI003D365EAB